MRCFQSLLSMFLLDYLPRRRGFSENTVASYRDAFSLLLRWLWEAEGVRPERVEVEDITPIRVAAFTEWLSAARGCSPATCNARVAALRSFARFAQLEEPAHLEACSLILEIPTARTPEAPPDHLTPEAVSLVVAAAERRGPRPHAVVSLLYDSGARASELCSLRVGDVAAGKHPSVVLRGKGQKTRVVPVSPQVGAILDAYVRTCREGAQPGDPLFVNARGGPLGRAGVAYILRRATESAHELDPDKVPGRSHPHALRHSKAMHMLEDGVNIVYIRDFLGHESVTTTERYARASTKAKREALQSAESRLVPCSPYTDSERSELLDWLASVV